MSPKNMMFWKEFTSDSAKGYKFPVATVDTKGSLGTQPFAQFGFPARSTGWISRRPHGLLLSPAAIVAIERIELHEVGVCQNLETVWVGEQFDSADTFPDERLQPLGIAGP